MGNILVFDSLTTTDAHIFGGINFLHDLNTGEEFSIGNTAAASVSFVTDVQLPLYTKDPVNGTFVWQQDDSPRGAIITDTQSYLAMGDDVLGWGTSSNKGRYFITEVTREKGKYTVTAYDAMILLETSISALSLTYPLTVSAAASAIATYIDCTILGDIHNGTMAAQDGTINETTTIRQLLAWVAEASGASVKIDGSDHLCFMYYAATGPTVTPSEIKEAGLEIADYTCAPIDNVTICDMAGMTSATAGSGTNSLFIVGNPFLYDATNTEAAVILSLVEDFEYAPLTCEMFDENGLEVGVTAVFGTTPTLVMHLESSEDGVVASSVGSDSRAEFNKTVEMIANEALTTAQEAQQTADELNLHFWYTASGAEAGAHIAEVDRETFESNPSGGNLLSNSTGIKVRDGLDELATFGASLVTVGKSNKGHVEIADSYVNLYDTNNKKRTSITASGLEIFDTDGSTSVASFAATATIGKAASGHVTVKSDGLHVWTGAEGTATNEVAFFGSTARIGTTDKQRVVIEPSGITFYGYNANASPKTQLMATLGFSSTAGASGTIIAPHWTVGSRTGTIGDRSVAEGENNEASNYCSYASGYNNHATGMDSRATGAACTASGAHSRANGVSCTASAWASVAIGDSTTANARCQTVIGEYNETDTGALFIIGNGSSSARSNAFKVTSTGNIYIPNGAQIYAENTNNVSQAVLQGCNSNGNCVLGYGGWSNSLGNTNIYGNAINMLSKGNINITGDIYNKDAYDNTNSYAANLYVGTGGHIYRTTNTSSRRYKKNIKDVASKELDPHNLYDLEVKQFKYRKGIITNENDCRYDKDLIGFISEQVKECYPIAVDINEDGECEAWNAQYIIPPMLALIQEQHEEIEDLKRRLS